jgi:maleate isomerase
MPNGADALYRSNALDMYVSIKKNVAHRMRYCQLGRRRHVAGAAALLDERLDLEPRPGRWRVGLIVLATDLTSERDFARLCPDEGLAIYANRIGFANPTNKKTLLAMHSLLTEAARLILPGEALNAIAYCCTAAAALIGDGAVRQAIQAAKPETPVITPTTAAFKAFETLQVRKISLLTPYTAVVTDVLANYFEAGGVEIVNAACLGLSDDTEIARIRTDSILAAASAAWHPNAEALFISCTALCAVPVVDGIEDRLGIPVITSNQAMFWQTIREAGCDWPVSNCGRLLRSH